MACLPTYTQQPKPTLGGPSSTAEEIQAQAQLYTNSKLPPSSSGGLSSDQLMQQLRKALTSSLSTASGPGGMASLTTEYRKHFLPGGKAGMAAGGTTVSAAGALHQPAAAAALCSASGAAGSGGFPMGRPGTSSKR